jgi:cyclophilin family peptidyl-prolyl cis-trans isomerase
MCYWNCKFHKIAHDYIAQSGDIMYQDGTGTCCVYEGDTFEMEKNSLKFREPYLMAAAKREDGQVGSQFFITLDELPMLNDEYTIFGRITKNNEIVDLINNAGSDSGKPSKTVLIKRSGIYKPTQKREMTAAELKNFKPDIDKNRS